MNYVPVKNYQCRVSGYSKTRILQYFILSIPATRERLPGEIIPESASQSCTYEDNEDQYGAEHAIDLDLNTSSWTCLLSGGTVWLQLKLDQVYCVEQVQEYNSNGSSLSTWTCSNTDCSHCEGIYCDSSFSLTVSTEAAVLYPVSDCKYGDTVKLQYTCKGHCSLEVYEISMTGRKSEISLV